MPEAGNYFPTPITGSDLPEELFAGIREQLLRHCRFDIGLYKDNCIKRRIAKRLRARGVSDFGSYLQLLTEEPAECDVLMTTLSIHVSQFFRNPSTFAALEGEILPELLCRTEWSGNRKVLLWSVGCAAGEEPYSLALLLEELDPRRRSMILASDLSADVLVRARQGLYDEARLAEVPRSIRERYFTREPEGYRLQETIRRRVRFERQDILSATPYPQADLILCRNVLIYFSRAEQEKILCRFAAALRRQGVLVLGKAETLVGEARRLFRSDSTGERIYRREDLAEDFHCS